ncbi:hypothetical protein M378DRAFT_170261 [Amanita muscaria Koide BX008]|uniref:Uncharacterized protein n=1 Tax=Amanita muscaria (strain Koide BX008) TaxID=946122 RepID=A0A0C2S7F7_AMAMK|nr:hypothetical protein M378DRAFT_170261 [Amanita muscaria Koide BX008]
MIVGLPLYRDPDWMDLNKTFTLDTGKASIPLIVVPPPCDRMYFPDIADTGYKHLSCPVPSPLF